VVREREGRGRRGEKGDYRQSQLEGRGWGGEAQAWVWARTSAFLLALIVGLQRTMSPWPRPNLLQYTGCSRVGHRKGDWTAARTASADRGRGTKASHVNALGGRGGGENHEVEPDHSAFKPCTFGPTSVTCANKSPRKPSLWLIWAATRSRLSKTSILGASITALLMYRDLCVTVT